MEHDLIQTAEAGDIQAQCNLASMYYYGKEVNKDYVQAAYWLDKAAEAGDPTAQRNLGSMYHLGEGVEKDDTQAVYWFRKSAEAGNVKAQRNLGSACHGGLGMERDVVQAIYWYHKAAKAGDAKAQYNLGNQYYNGNGIEKDYVQAAFWLQKAAESEDPTAAVHAQSLLGIMYDQGLGVEQNHMQAIFWYRKAAEAGDARAQFNLGTMYCRCNGLEKDYVQAAFWLQKAIEAGDPTTADYAQRMLDMLYDQGLVVKQNHIQDTSWHNTTAETGSTDAQCVLLNNAVAHFIKDRTVMNYDKVLLALFNCLKNDASFLIPVQMNLTPDKQMDMQLELLQANDGFWYYVAHATSDEIIKEKAKSYGILKVEKLLRKAVLDNVANGIMLVQHNEVSCLIHTNTINVILSVFDSKTKIDNKIDSYWNSEEVTHDLIQTAEAGSIQAQRNLSSMYYYGEGAEKDYVQAAYWYRKLAEAGDAAAQCFLAFMYLAGRGVEKDNTKSAYWYRKGAESGDPVAKKLLANIPKTREIGQKHPIQIHFQPNIDEYKALEQCERNVVDWVASVVANTILYNLAFVPKDVFSLDFTKHAISAFIYWYVKNFTTEDNVWHEDMPVKVLDLKDWELTFGLVIAVLKAYGIGFSKQPTGEIHNIFSNGIFLDNVTGTVVADNRTFKGLVYFTLENMKINRFSTSLLVAIERYMEKETGKQVRYFYSRKVNTEEYQGRYVFEPYKK